MLRQKVKNMDYMNCKESFKRETARLAVQIGVKEMSRRLDIPESVVDEWVTQYGKKHYDPEEINDILRISSEHGCQYAADFFNIPISKVYDIRYRYRTDKYQRTPGFSREQIDEILRISSEHGCQYAADFFNIPISKVYDVRYKHKADRCRRTLSFSRERIDEILRVSFEHGCRKAAELLDIPIEQIYRVRHVCKKNKYGRSPYEEKTIDEALSLLKDYGIGAVSRMLGIPPKTLSGWKKRYGTPEESAEETPQKAYTIYSDETVQEALRLMKDFGIATVSKMLDIPYDTLSNWKYRGIRKSAEEAPQEARTYPDYLEIPEDPAAYEPIWCEEGPMPKQEKAQTAKKKTETAAQPAEDTEALHARIHDLEAEVTRLTEENSFLKEACAYFASGNRFQMLLNPPATGGKGKENK